MNTIIRQATAKQFFAVANHFASLHNDGTAQDLHRLRKQFSGVLGAFTNDPKNGLMTHEDVQKFLALTEVPKVFVKMLKPKAAKNVWSGNEEKPKAKPAKAKTAKAEEPKAKRGRPTNTAKLKETNDRIDLLEAKLDKILEVLAK